MRKSYREQSRIFISTGRSATVIASPAIFSKGDDIGKSDYSKQQRKLSRRICLDDQIRFAPSAEVAERGMLNLMKRGNASTVELKAFAVLFGLEVADLLTAFRRADRSVGAIARKARRAITCL